MKELPIRFATAWHEAGHAIVAYCVGRKFKSISIVPDDDSLGHILFFPRRWFTPETDMNARIQNAIKEDVMISWAGMLAEAEFMEMSLSEVASEDIYDFQLAAYVCGTVEEEEAYIEWLRVRAVNILSMPSNRFALRSLAMKLIKERTMTGKQACAVIETAIERYFSSEMKWEEPGIGEPNTISMTRGKRSSASSAGALKPIFIHN